jgi:hypothetical protein
MFSAIKLLLPLCLKTVTGVVIICKHYMGQKKWNDAAFIGFILSAFLCLPARAQTENWDTYMAKFGDKPGSVLVNMGLIDIAPDRKYPFLVITGPKTEKCNKRGLPDKEQIDELEEILSATDNFLTGVTAKVLVGTFTYNCERLNYYYVKDTSNIRNAIMRMYNRGYANYSYAINMKYEPQWETYRTFLYPSDETITWMENDKIITKMMQQGDSLSGRRDIHFELTFASTSDRKLFAEFEKTKGYEAVAFPDPDFKSTLSSVVLKKSGYVKIDFIDSLADGLKKDVAKYHGDYKGWQASLPKK